MIGAYALRTELSCEGSINRLRFAFLGQDTDTPTNLQLHVDRRVLTRGRSEKFL